MFKSFNKLIVSNTIKENYFVGTKLTKRKKQWEILYEELFLEGIIGYED
jgi:hypothetical protein